MALPIVAGVQLFLKTEFGRYVLEEGVRLLLKKQELDPLEVAEGVRACVRALWYRVGDSGAAPWVPAPIAVALILEKLTSGLGVTYTNAASPEVFSVDASEVAVFAHPTISTASLYGGLLGPDDLAVPASLRGYAVLTHIARWVSPYLLAQVHTTTGVQREPVAEVMLAVVNSIGDRVLLTSE